MRTAKLSIILRSRFRALLICVYFATNKRETLYVLALRYEVSPVKNAVPISSFAIFQESPSIFDETT